jgi:hypothetical protein
MHTDFKNDPDYPDISSKMEEAVAISKEITRARRRRWPVIRCNFKEGSVLLSLILDTGVKRNAIRR